MLTSSNPQSSGDTSRKGDENEPIQSGMSIAELAEQIAEGATEPLANPPAASESDFTARVPHTKNYDPRAYDPSTYGLLVTGETASSEAAMMNRAAAAFDAEIAQVQAVGQAPNATPQQSLEPIDSPVTTAPAMNGSALNIAQQAEYAAAFDAEIAQAQTMHQSIPQTVDPTVETAIAMAQQAEYAAAFDAEIAQAQTMHQSISQAVDPRVAVAIATAQQAEHAAAFDAAIAEARQYASSTAQSHHIPPFSSTFASEPLPHPSERLLPYLQPDAVVQWDPAEIAIAPLPVYSQGMLANAYFFGNPRWNKKYLEEEHQGAAFCDRWHHALRRLNNGPINSGWDDKVVVDLGCGPGNLFQRLGGDPALLIGVDISYGALRRAQQVGYTALLADAHHLPLRDGIADVVVANALLHHCDDMARVLAEAARLVKPGGYLITDLDPQRSAWDRCGWGLWLQQIQFPSFPGFGDSVEEQAWRIATEVHNRQPGVGIEASLYPQVLVPWGFEVQLYPHNHRVGAEVFGGARGRSPLKTRLSQRLSGLDPAGAKAAQSIMCIARRTV